MTANSQPQPWNDASVHEFGRDFLTFSVQHGIHCVPIDDVSSRLAATTHGERVMAQVALLLAARGSGAIML
jgi:hypothetical protein